MYKIRVSHQKGKTSIDRIGEARTTAGLRYAVLNMLEVLEVSYDFTELLATMNSTLLRDKAFNAAVDSNTNLKVTYAQE